MSLSTWALNTDKTVAVSRGGVYWMPIDENTPRNVKVLAIARHQAGIGQPATIHTHEIPLCNRRVSPLSLLSCVEA